MGKLYLELTINPGTDDEDVSEACIVFSSRRTVKACAATRTDPAWPDEWEHEIDAIHFVTGERMTPEQRAFCQAEFGRRLDECAEIAAEELADEADERADYDRDRWYDDRMMGLI